MQPKVKSFVVTTDDDHSIGATLYKSKTARRNLIIIGPAAAAPQTYYRNFAHFAASGFEFDALTFDYRSIGESLIGSIKDSEAKFSDWGKYDLNAIIKWADKKYDKVFLIGHSVTGQVYPLASMRKRITAAYMVACSAPYQGYWTGIQRLKVLLFWHLIIPVTTTIKGYLPGWAMGGKVGLSRAAAWEWRKWGVNKEGIYLTEVQARDQYNDIHIPMHFVGLSDDQAFAPARAIQALMYKYGNARTFYQFIKPKDLGVKAIGHFGFFRKSYEEKLWSMPILFFNQYLKDF